MPKTIEIKVYKFSELSTEAQEKAIQNHWDWNVDYEWWDNVYYDANENSLFKITEFDIDRGDCCKGEFTETAMASAISILQNHGETCDTWKEAYDFAVEYRALEKRFEFADEMHYLYDHGKNRLYETNQESDCEDRFLKWEEMRREIEDEMEDLETEFLNTMQNEYLSMLRREYEYLTSEESIRETLESNDHMEFTEDGEDF